MGVVTQLFLKREHGVALEPATTIDCNQDGIAGNVACAPFRQALIASSSVTADLGLRAADLRENVVVDFDGLYDLPSGTVVKIGEVLIRLTFHCEPCKKILKLVDFDRILHRRGVFGTFLNSANITVGDTFAVTDQKFEAIPYAIGERIRWYLRRHGASAAALNLVHELGLPASSAKVVPEMVRKLVFFSGASSAKGSCGDTCIEQ
jgi:hypothetical protein